MARRHARAALAELCCAWNVVNVLLLLFLAVFVTPHAPGSSAVCLKRTTAKLSAPRQELAATSIGNLAIFAGGLGGGIVSAVIDIFDTSTGKWSYTFLSDSRQWLAATTVADVALFGGGWAGWGYTTAVDVYNSTSRSWSTASLSAARGWLAATSVRDVALFGGGRNDTHKFSVVDMFNVTSLRWTAATLSVGRDALGAASVGDVAMFAGGWDGVRYVREIDIFSATTASWSVGLLSTGRFTPGTTSVGDLLLVGGGSWFSTRVDIFNYTASTWSIAELSLGRQYHTAASVGNAALFGGGESGAGGTDVVDIYDRATGIWTNSTLSVARNRLTATSLGGRFAFFAGGFDIAGGVETDVVDIFEVCSSSTPPASSAAAAAQTTSPRSTPAVLFVLLGVGGAVALLAVCAAVGGALAVWLRGRRGAGAGPVPLARGGGGGGALAGSVDLLPLQRSTSVTTVAQATGVKVLTGILLGKPLGQGNFGAVFLGDWNGTPVALKTLGRDGNVSAFLSEVSILTALTHPNVVQFLGTWGDLRDGQPYMVFEHVSGGDLLTHLHESAGVPLAPKIGVLVGACRGMLFLAENKIVHRDLACRNLLIDAAGTVKVSDFGMSRLVEDYYESADGRPLPTRWCAPEVLTHRMSSTRSDVYSFGIVMWEVMSGGGVPFPMLDTNKEVRDVVIAGRTAGALPQPVGCPDALFVLMTACWALEPRERPTFAAVLEQLLVISAAHGGGARSPPPASPPGPPPYPGYSSPPPYHQPVDLGYSL